MHANNFHTPNGNKLGCWEAYAYRPPGMAKIVASGHNYIVVDMYDNECWGQVLLHASFKVRPKLVVIEAT